MSKMPLFIHTFNREEQTTYAQFPDSLKERTFFVVQEREAKLWVKKKVNVLVLPPHIQKLSPTRQWILEYGAKKNMQSICMMDDDLKFQHRYRDKGKLTLKPVSGDEVEFAFEAVEEVLSSHEYIHSGMGHREYNNTVPGNNRKCCAMLRVLAYRPKEVLKLGCRFDRVGVRQDLDMTLQLVTHGYPNYVTYEYTQSHQKNNATGGCSTYRTDAFVAQELKKFIKLNRPYITVTENTKGRVSGPTIIIHWKKSLGAANKKGFF